MPMERKKASHMFERSAPRERKLDRAFDIHTKIYLIWILRVGLRVEFSLSLDILLVNGEFARLLFHVQKTAVRLSDEPCEREHADIDPVCHAEI